MFPDPHASHRRAALLLAFCALLWSIAGVVTRQLERADGFEVTFWRGLFCAVTVLVILAWQQRGNPFAPVREMGWPGLFSGAMWGVMFTCFMLALTRTSVANTLLVMSISPLLAALLGRVVLGARLSAATWIAIVMAGVGIWWMVHEGVTADGLDYERVVAGQQQPAHRFQEDFGTDEVLLRLTRAVDPGDQLAEIIRPAPSERMIIFQWTIVNGTGSGALVTEDAAKLKVRYEEDGDTRTETVSAAVIAVNNKTAPTNVAASGTATVQAVFIVPEDAQVLELRFSGGFSVGGVKYVFE